MHPRAVVIPLLAILTACEGPAGPEGPPGGPGPGGVDGLPGDIGLPGEDGLSPWNTAPGVEITIDDLTMTATSGVVTFTITDPDGVPLDRSGRLTTGAVNVSFVLGQLAEDTAGVAAQYTAYTTRVQTAPDGTMAIQGATESTGVFETISLADGHYAYTFAAPLTGFDPALTQTVLGVATRTVDGVQAITRATHSVRPAGGDPTVRSVVGDSSCASCHGTLAAHGGRYDSVSQCVMCHTPQSSDPDTGNTVDFKVMLHKIHRGAELPSVIGGTPYQIIGFAQSVNDFSDVEFPQPIQKCTACHGGAAQADAWSTRTAKPACVSCHDNVSFVLPLPPGEVLHSGGVQPDDAPCGVCHPSTGSIAGIIEHHALLTDASQVVIALTDAGPAAPGTPLGLTFRVTVDGAPRDILAPGLALTKITATMAGPNTDIATYVQATAQGSGATGTLTAVNAADGVFHYVFPVTIPVPVTATGSYTVGIEGYLQDAAGTRFATVSPTRAFAVTDAVATARRVIVDPAKCNGCHADLNGHGGGRKGAGYCILCHNPANANDERAARFESSTILAESVDFRVMIHKIHGGEGLTQPYTIYGFPAPAPATPGGTPLSFADMRYPRPISQCSACHADGTWNVPVDSTAPSTLQEMSCSEPPGQDTDAYCTSPFWTMTASIPVRPEAAACTSCHDQPFVAAHAAVNTTPQGVESCATCHGSGAMWDVSLVHMP